MSGALTRKVEANRSYLFLDLVRRGAGILVHDVPDTLVARLYSTLFVLCQN